MHIRDLRVNAFRYAWVPSARLVEVKIYKYIIVKHCLKNKFTRGPDVLSRNGKFFEDIL